MTYYYYQHKLANSSLLKVENKSNKMGPKIEHCGTPNGICPKDYRIYFFLFFISYSINSNVLFYMNLS